MNLEKLSIPIATESKNEREKELRERLMTIQVLHAKKLFDADKKDGKNTLLGNILKENTAIMNGIKNTYHHMDIQEQDAIISSIIDNLNDLGEKNASGEELVQYLLEQYAIAQKYKAQEVDQSHNEKQQKEMAGIINYEHSTKHEEKMTEAGFSPTDEFLEIHFPPLYESDTQSSLPLAIKDSFTALSEVIIQKFPHAKAIIGSSWLLSLPIAQRLGFIQIQEMNKLPQSGAVWNQFIDQHGNISKDRLRKFMETGETPYKETFAYIPIQEFLSRYLPPKKRGNIILKDINPNYDSTWEKNRKVPGKEREMMQKEFDTFIENKDITPEQFIASFPTIERTSKDIGFFEDLMTALQKAREEKLSFKEFGKGFEGRDDIRRKFTDYEEKKKSEKYIDKEVFIP